MNLVERLGHHRDRPLAAALVDCQRAVDRVLTCAIPESGASNRLNAAMRYAAIGSGKRVRAMLTMLSAKLVGGASEHSIRVAAAIECVHAQSLVHDDLPCMDDDDIRRGKPTVHRKYDEATAVLAGDSLLALAFQILADENTHPDAAIRINLVSKLAIAIGHDGLASGQMMDLYGTSEPTRETVRECGKRKTGRLFRFAVQAGTLLGHCTPAEKNHLLTYAEKLGLAFQFRDDLLDDVGDAVLVGKTLRKDKVAGKLTLPSIYGFDQAIAEASLLVQESRAELMCFGERATALADLAEFVIMREM